MDMGLAWLPRMATHYSFIVLLLCAVAIVIATTPLLERRLSTALGLARGSLIIALISALVLTFSIAPLVIAVPIVLGLALFLFLIVRSNARLTAYACTKCSAQFQVSACVDFLSPHKPNRKLLRCPQCSNVDWQPSA